MPLLKDYSNAGLAVWEITEDCPTLLRLLDDPVTEKEMEMIRSVKRRCEKIACRLLLKILTGHVVRVAYRTNGVPYLPNESLSVSFTHTKNYAAVILSGDRAPGIDMEYRSERIRKIRKAFLSPAEEMRLSDDCTTEQLLICWCAKEAFYKMIPDGKSEWFARFEVSPFDCHDSGTVTITSPDAGVRAELSYLVTSRFIMVHSL